MAHLQQGTAVGLFSVLSVLLEPGARSPPEIGGGGGDRAGFLRGECLCSLSHSGMKQILAEGKTRWARRPEGSEYSSSYPAERCKMWSEFDHF